MRGPEMDMCKDITFKGLYDKGDSYPIDRQRHCRCCSLHSGINCLGLLGLLSTDFLHSPHIQHIEPRNAPLEQERGSIEAFKVDQAFVPHSDSGPFIASWYAPSANRADQLTNQGSPVVDLARPEPCEEERGDKQCLERTKKKSSESTWNAAE